MVPHIAYLHTGIWAAASAGHSAQATPEQQQQQDLGDPSFAETLRSSQLTPAGIAVRDPAAAAAAPHLGLILTPQASPGYYTSDPAAAAAEDARKLRHTGSSVTSRPGGRSSIDSLNSPSFREAAAAATYDNGHYSTVTIGGGEVDWASNAEADEASSRSPAAAAAEGVLGTQLSSSVAAAAAAALRASGMSGHSIGNSAVFENSLFDGMDDDEDDDDNYSIPPVSSRSRGEPQS